MRAAVVYALGGEPAIEEFPDPAHGNEIIEVVAAPLNPVNLIIEKARRRLL